MMFDLSPGKKKHDPLKIFELSKIGILSKNEVWVSIIQPYYETPFLLKKLSKKYKLELDSIEIFYTLAKRKKRIDYKDNEIRQSEINRLYDLRNNFLKGSGISKIRRIEIDLSNGEKFKITNRNVLDNFHIKIVHSMREFISDFIVPQYKPIPKVKGRDKGLLQANKSLARKILGYLEGSSDFEFKQKGDILLSLFRLAENPLPYSEPETCVKKLKYQKR